VQGLGRISTAPDLLARFEFEGKLPRSVLVIEVKRVFFQCARAIKRSGLWDPASRIERASLPSTGAILQALSPRVDGAAYDAELQARQASTLY
jgi:hypothetical protein